MKALRCELNKAIINIGFFGAAIMTCLLCFTSVAYVELATSKTYSVFEALITFERSFIRSRSDFASEILFTRGLTGYISMFIPIIVAFPFMVTFCAERNSGLMRFTITRIGKYRYYLSKFAAAFISGGLAVLLGVLMYGAIVAAVFPSLSSYELSGEQIEAMLPLGVLPTFIRTVSSAFLYGGISAMPAFFISSFCKNPYIITCLPFMLIYVWDTSINRVLSLSFEKGNYGVYEIFEPFRPDSVWRFAYYREITPTFYKMIIFSAAYLLILLIGFIVIMNGRTDSGS